MNPDVVHSGMLANPAKFFSPLTFSYHFMSIKCSAIRIVSILYTGRDEKSEPLIISESYLPYSTYRSALCGIITDQISINFTFLLLILKIVNKSPNKQLISGDKVRTFYK